MNFLFKIFKNRVKDLPIVYFILPALFLFSFSLCYLLFSNLITEKYIFAEFKSAAQKRSIASSDLKKNFRLNQEKKKEFYVSLIKSLNMEISPHYLIVSIQQGEVLCKDFFNFELVFETQGFAINGIKPFIKVKDFCNFKEDILVQIPLDSQKESKQLEYYLGFNKHKGFYQYENWRLVEISFKGQNMNLVLTKDDLDSVALDFYLE